MSRLETLGVCLLWVTGLSVVLISSFAVAAPGDPPESPNPLSLVAQVDCEASPLATIYFDFDETAVRRDQEGRLEELLPCLAAQPERQLVIAGHTDPGIYRLPLDDSGEAYDGSAYLLALGEREARGVRQFLEQLGVDGTRIDVLSYGPFRPICSEMNESCWRQLRRAEVRWVTEEPTEVPTCLTTDAVARPSEGTPCSDHADCGEDAVCGCDADGRLVVRDTGASVETFDELGRPVSLEVRFCSDAVTRRWSYTYSEDGLLQLLEHDLGGDGTFDDRVTYGYDEHNTRVSVYVDEGADGLVDEVLPVSDVGDDIRLEATVHLSVVEIVIHNHTGEAVELQRALRVEHLTDAGWERLDGIAQLWIRDGCWFGGDTLPGIEAGVDLVTVESGAEIVIEPWLGTVGDAQCRCTRCAPVPTGQYRIVAQTPDGELVSEPFLLEGE